MTIDQLRGHFQLSEQAKSPAFQATVQYLLENPPEPQKQRDPTTIVNDEGFQRGWMACVKVLRSLHINPEQPKPTSYVPFSEAAQTKPK